MLKRRTWVVTLAMVLAVCASSVRVGAQGSRGTITGTILDAAGVKQTVVVVVLTGAADGVDRRGLTDPDGVYIFGGLPPGAYRLRVEDDRFAPWSQDQITVAAGQRLTLNVTLRPRIAPGALLGSIGGTVIGPDGLPAGGAAITLTSTGAPQRATSDRSGAYAFPGLTAGTYVVHVALPGALAFDSDLLVVRAGENRPYDIRIQPLPPPPPPVVVDKPATPVGTTVAPTPETKKETKTTKEPETKKEIPPPPPSGPGFETTPDRWRGFDWPEVQRYQPSERMPRVGGNPFDPYNQNPLKGDLPIGNGHTFVNLNLQFNAALNPRVVGSAATGTTTQLFYNQNAVAGVEVFGGDTAFEPKRWSLRATTVVNLNALANGSLSFSELKRPTVAGGAAAPIKFNIEELFLEKRLMAGGPAFDFASVRVGMQNFNADFRGYVYVDNQLGARLFGNGGSNRVQYNAAFFSMRERDPGTLLHTIQTSTGQNVFVANIFVQDFGARGYTAMANVLVNRDSRVGAAGTTGALQATYVGVHGDGRWGGWSVSHAAYAVFGTDENAAKARVLKRPDSLKVGAQMAAIELSRDADWKRLRGSFFYASGDSGADPAKAGGFDAIADNPNLAGGQFMYWTQQGINVPGLGLISDKLSLLPSLRGKTARANFLNPGLIAANGGIDLRVSPSLKVVTNASWLRFADAATLRQLRPAGSAGLEDNSIGLDFSLGFKWRPFVNENLFLVAGYSLLKPQGGFATVLGKAGMLSSGFATFQLVF